MRQYQKNCTQAILLMLCLFPGRSFPQFRVVGYVSLWAQGLPHLSDSTMQRLTHLNIAFVNPDSLGNLLLPAGVDSLIEQAHSAKIKALISFGGGKFNPYYAGLLNDENRQAFIQKLVQLAVVHQLDGIDADLENDNLDKNYEAFIIDLSAALKKKDKLLTAALATWNAERISNTAIRKFDFINIMSYDQTGPWRPTEPGPHSTYEKAVADLYYWTHTRHVPKKKLNLGLPFYGYCFGTNYGESMSYGNIIANFPAAAQQDTIMPTGGGAIYYNGLSTIQNKTKMALEHAGGVMIWQLLQDAPGAQSLLGGINDLIKKNAGSKVYSP